MGPSIGCRTSLAELLLPSHLLVLISPGSACLLILIIRNRLKYALSYCEVISILMQHHVLVDGKVRTDKTYPAGFMDVFPSPRQTRTAGCFMTPRFASVFTQSGMRMLSSSSARLGLFRLARRAYPLPEHL